MRGGRPQCRVLGAAQWYTWMVDSCQSIIKRTCETGKFARQRRSNVRRRAVVLCLQAKRVMCVAHNRAVRAVARVTDRIAIGDLSHEGIARGKRGAMHSRRKLCGLAQLRDRFKCSGGALGVSVGVVNEGGTTGTCAWCLNFERKNSSVRTLHVNVIDFLLFRCECMLGSSVSPLTLLSMSCLHPISVRSYATSAVQRGPAIARRLATSWRTTSGVTPSRQRGRHRSNTRQAHLWRSVGRLFGISFRRRREWQ